MALWRMRATGRALGQQQEVQLDELVSLALEKAPDLRPRLEALADAKRAQVLPLALRVDPRAHDDIAAQGPICLVQIHPGMGGSGGPP